MNDRLYFVLIFSLSIVLSVSPASGEIYKCNGSYQTEPCAPGQGKVAKLPKIIKYDWLKKEKEKIDMREYVREMIDKSSQSSERQILQRHQWETTCTKQEMGKPSRKREQRHSIPLWQKDYSYVREEGQIYNHSLHGYAQESKNQMSTIAKR